MVKVAEETICGGATRIIVAAGGTSTGGGSSTEQGGGGQAPPPPKGKSMDIEIGGCMQQQPTPQQGSGVVIVDTQYSSTGDSKKLKAHVEPKGTWTHAAYHLTSATAGPPLLSLPYAMAALGWGPGLVALAFGAAITYYSCLCLSRAMAHLERTGCRSFRFGDLSRHVLGPSWTCFVVAPLQLSVCFMVVIGGTLLGGQAMKGMYYTYYEAGSGLQLSEFVTIFGFLVLLVAQIPSMHALRHFNMVSILLCFGYSLCAIVGSILAGMSKEAGPRDYTVEGSQMTKLFGIFTAISVMMTSYSNPLVVEIQACLAEPVGKKMVKGLSVCYGVAVATFFPVAVTGYWAFGNRVAGVILLNMTPASPTSISLVPRSLFFIANACACLQLTVYTVLHLHPTFERMERAVAGRVWVRATGRGSIVVVSTLLAAMLPFFVDFSAFMGALGFTPICVFLPLLFYNIICKPSPRSLTFWVNYVIMSGAVVVALLGTVSSVHQIVVDATTYRLFADV